MSKVKIVDPGLAEKRELTYDDVPFDSFFYATLCGERSFYYKPCESLSDKALCIGRKAYNRTPHGLTNIEPIAVEIHVIRD